MWMVVGWYSERWWETSEGTNCTPEQLAKAVDGYFSVDSLNSVIGNKKAISGLVSILYLYYVLLNIVVGFATLICNDTVDSSLLGFFHIRAILRI